MKSLNELLADKAALVEKQETLAATGKENYDKYDDDAKAEWRGAIKANDDALETLEADIAAARALDKNAGRAADLEELRKGQTEEPKVEVLSEPAVYNPDEDRRMGNGSIKFLVDVAKAKFGDYKAQERLQRHEAQVAEEYRKETGLELRDVGTGAFAGLVVPQYLTDLVAPVRRAGRPFADICRSLPLPPDGMTVNISRITTGTAAAPQATENSGAQETDADDTLLTVNVRTIAGMQDVSRQAVDRGVGVDTVLLQDLASAYNTKLDYGILNDDGTSGTHLGVRSVSGIKTATYTDASPTAAEAYPSLWDLQSQITSAVYADATHIVLHPRRAKWFGSQVGSTFPFIQPPGAPSTVQGGSFTGEGYGGITMFIAGLPVVEDANIPITIGAGAEDPALVVTAPECFLWEEPGSPMRIRAEEVLANQLSVRFVVFGYSAFTAGRYPGAHGAVSGTGYTTPAFS